MNRRLQVWPYYALAIVSGAIGATLLYFNLGSGAATPVRQVVEIIRDAFGDDRLIVEDTNKFRKFDRESLTPEIAKILQQTD